MTALLIASILAAAGVVARTALVPLIGPRVPFALVFVAVVLATILGGWRSGVLSTFIGQVLAWYLIYEPVYTFKLLAGADAGALITATLCQLAIVAVVGLYQYEIGKQQEAREMLVAELNHRVKNTLSVVQSLAQQTLRTGSQDEVPLFEARLQALAGAHDLLTSTNWSKADLREVIRKALHPFALPEDRLAIGGPSVTVLPKTAVNLTLVIHELATNAIKYGALSTEEGAVEVSWTDGEGFPGSFSWTERGGPRVSPPTRKGFGTRLIQRGLAAELGAKVNLQFKPTGLECRLQRQNSIGAT